MDIDKVQDALNSFQQVVLLDPDHADAYFNMAIIHQEHAADESIGKTHFTFTVTTVTDNVTQLVAQIDKVVRKQELEKALRSYQAVESLRAKIDKDLLDEAQKGIALIEHMLRACGK